MFKKICLNLSIYSVHILYLMSLCCNIKLTIILWGQTGTPEKNITRPLSNYVKRPVM